MNKKNINISNKIYNIKDNIYLKDIINARKKALDNNFQFFKFNDSIYFIDEKRNLHKTKLL